MILWPVIERELRVGSRQQFTYWLRVIGGGTLLLTCTLFSMGRGFDLDSGAALFGTLHRTLFWAIWILVPLMTADCLSRERREGTMGLLFLTPLRARDIVAAKGLVHGLRAFTLWAAMIPVLTIPFLMGGVTWQQAMLAVCMDFSSITWALAAGLMASASNKSWSRAMISAAIWGVFFFGIFAYAVGLWTWSMMNSAVRLSGMWVADSPGWQTMYYGLAIASDGSWPWRGWMSRMGIPTNGLILLGVKTVIVSVLGFVLVLLCAAQSVRRRWQELPPSALRLWLDRVFCRPVILVDHLRGWMRWKLERNPVGWLEVRTWNARLVTWGWFAVIVSLYTFAMSNDTLFTRNASAIQGLMGWLLIGSLAMSAAGSFRRERETGVLELLLVSPLSATEIVNGRLRGLWGQFMPAFALLFLAWSYWTTWLPGRNESTLLWSLVTTFLTLPVVGLYFSLSRRSFIAALLCTFLVGVVLPNLLMVLLMWASEVLLFQSVPLPGAVAWRWVTLAMQCLIAVVVWLRLRQALTGRKFELDRGLF